MVLDLVNDVQRPLPQCWLYRCEDRSPFAYAHGEDFVRYGDHVRWARRSGNGLISVRSGECLAYEVDGVFYDSVSHEAVYYEAQRPS